jgi:murein DD-endopeptidase MepM/ murein hydrolase activator NlpD
MGEAVDLKAAIPNLKMRGGMQAYDQALRTRLQAVTGLSEPANEASAMNAMRAQQEAYQQRLAGLQGQGNAGGVVPSGAPTGNGRWRSPVNGNVIFGYGQRYGSRNAAVTGSPTHRGLDFGGAAGTPVYAPSAGTLIGTGVGGWNGGRGNFISAQFGNNGPYGLFEHLQKLAPGIKPGMAITPGMLLGYIGATGNANGVNHLHFETRWNLNDGSTSFDPSSWFGW